MTDDARELIDAAGGTPPGSLRAALANAMVGLKKRYYGRGPEAAKAFIEDDYIFVVLEGGMTRNEETLLAAGKEDLVRQYRLTFQDVVGPTATGAVEELTGRKVIGYHSQVVFEPFRAFEIFVLEPGSPVCKRTEPRPRTGDFRAQGYGIPLMAQFATAERARSASANPIDRARRQREDQRLMRKVQTGDDRAREELIERYMPLARSLALRYRRASEPLDDLIQVASVGLVKAVDRWDPERGLAFSSYAVPTILGELRRYFRDSTWDVRPARDLQELCLALEEAREALWGELGRQPTVADLAGRLERQPEEIVEALQATEGRSVRSLDAPVHDEENDSASAGDLIGTHDEEFDRVEAGVTLERLTGILDDRAREILRLRFAEDLLQSEIAEMVGCSQMHVSRIIRSSLEKLYAYGSGMQVEK